MKVRVRAKEYKLTPEMSLSTGLTALSLINYVVLTNYLQVTSVLDSLGLRPPPASCLVKHLKQLLRRSLMTVRHPPQRALNGFGNTGNTSWLLLWPDLAWL